MLHQFTGFLDRIGNNAQLEAIGWNLWKQWRRTTPCKEWTIHLLIKCQLIKKKILELIETPGFNYQVQQRVND